MTDRPKQLKNPEDIAVEFVRSWQCRDADGIAALFEPDAEFVNVTGLWWHDREAIRAAHAYGLATIFPNSTLRLRDTRVKWITEEVAVVHARMSLAGQSPVGGVPAPKLRQTLFSFVVRKTPSGWRCVSAQNTEIAPGMETNVVDEGGHLRAVDYRQKPARD